MPKMLRTKTRLRIFHYGSVKGIVMYTEYGSSSKSMINILIFYDVYLTNRVVGQNIVLLSIFRGCLGILHNVIYANLKRDINNEYVFSSKLRKCI